MIRLRFLTGMATLLTPVIAFAQNTIYCGDLPGCHGGTSGGWESYIDDFLGIVQTYLPLYAAPVATLFVIIGGGYLLFHLGDDQRAETGKKTIMYALIGLAVILFARTFIFTFVATETLFDPNGILSVDSAVSIINALIRIAYTFFNTALIIAILYNAGRMIVSRGADDEYSKAKQGFFYAFIGAVILNTVDFIIWIVMNLGLQ
jgi:hypothetical protein